MTDPDDYCLTRAEVATILKVTKRTVTNLARNGTLRCCRLTRKIVRFCKSQVEAFKA